MNWKDISLRQFLQLKEATDIENEEERVLAYAEIVLGEHVSDLPISEFVKETKNLEFLKTEIPTSHLVRSISVNGRKYTIDALIGHLSTAQYLDYTNYLKNVDNYKEMLSVFFIPEGHKYNDGYDMRVVQEDMLDLPIDVVNSECFFFSEQLTKFIQIFQSSLRKQIKKKKDLTPEMKRQLTSLLESTLSLVSSPISLSSVK